MGRIAYISIAVALVVGVWFVTGRGTPSDPDRPGSISDPVATAPKQEWQTPKVERDYTKLASYIKADMTMDQCVLILGEPESRWFAKVGSSKISFGDTDAESWRVGISRMAGEEAGRAFVAACEGKRVQDVIMALDAEWMPTGPNDEPVACLRLGPKRIAYVDERADPYLGEQGLKVGDLHIDLELFEEYRPTSGRLAQMASGFRRAPRFAACWGELTLFFDREWRVTETFLLPK